MRMDAWTWGIEDGLKTAKREMWRASCPVPMPAARIHVGILWLEDKRSMDGPALSSKL